jgi:hypothetical protein
MGKTKNRAVKKTTRFLICPAARNQSGLSALTSLEARVGLVDDIDPALAADDAAILIAELCRFQRITNLHDQSLWGQEILRRGTYERTPPLSTPELRDFFGIGE